MRKNILITGEPKSGKSTLLESVISDHPNRIGFLTKEIRQDDVRVGFEMVLNNGQKTILADVDRKGNNKIGKFFVYPQNIRPLIAQLSLPFDNKSLLYIDEIGQMQLFCDFFRKTVLRFFEAPNICIAIITSVYEDDFTQDIKRRSDVILVKITQDDREERALFIKQLLKKIDKAKLYSAEPKRWIFNNNSHATLHSEHGIRQLTYRNHAWHCECDFFRANNLCSHTMSVEEIMTEVS